LLPQPNDGVHPYQECQKIQKLLLTITHTSFYSN
jgi:hypothetical protein